MSVINTNTISLNAQRNLSTNSASLSTTIQRLSSGLRINSAKDDAAGLAISERFSTQIRGANQAARNANDGISLAQTAEGALGEIGNNLQRIRELSVQSRNATNSDTDRAALNAEVQLLKAEIQRVAEQTNFNGKKLLDGSFQNQAFQVGANQGQTISVAQIANANISKLGNWNQAATSATVTGVAATGAGGTAGTATVAGAAPTGVTTAGTTTPATAGAASFSATGLLGDYSAANGASSFDVTIDSGTAITVNLATDINDGDALANAINSAIGAAGTATFAGGNITITSASDGAASTVAVGNLQRGTGSPADPTLPTVTPTGGQDAVTSGGGTTFAAIGNGEFTINGTSIQVGTATNAAGRGADLLAAINAQTATTGVIANVNATTGALELSSTTGAIEVGGTGNLAQLTGLTAGTTQPTGGTSTFSAGSFTLQGVLPSGDNSEAITISYDKAGSASERANNLVTAINNQSYNTGVTASLKDGKVELASANGNFTVGLSAGDDAAGLLAQTGLAAGATANFAEGAAATGFAQLDISTERGAENAILAMDAALNSVNSARADLGAVQNRFSSVVANLQTGSENLSASRSRIVDTDFAKETAELSRTQILQQAGTAMLAQANQIPQNVLSLLR